MHLVVPITVVVEQVAEVDDDEPALVLPLQGLEHTFIELVDQSADELDLVGAARQWLGDVAGDPVADGALEDGEQAGLLRAQLRRRAKKPWIGISMSDHGETWS